MKNFVVAGIGTGIGKTLISAILTEALQADYWKPIQAGNLEHSDSHEVAALISNQHSRIHSEAYRLREPMSPHAAAHLEGITIDEKKLTWPTSNNQLVVELAGGIMVPINQDCLNIDLLTQWQKPVVIVSQNYLGSINHTLLTVQALKQKDIQIAGIIFNGPNNQSSEDFILSYTGLTCLARIPQFDTINKTTVKQQAQHILNKL